MSLPLTTRFGVDPTVDEELANKRYVDNSSGGSSFGFITWQFATAMSSNVMTFFGCYGVTNSNTEGDVTLIQDNGFTVIRHRSHVRLNSKNGNTLLSFEDDSIAIGQLTIAAAATGDFDSGALTDVVAAGSEIDFGRDTSASSSGTITIGLSHVNVNWD